MKVRGVQMNRAGGEANSHERHTVFLFLLSMCMAVHIHDGVSIEYRGQR